MSIAVVVGDLPDRATIMDVSRSAGTGGAYPEARATRATNVPVRRGLPSAGEMNYAAQRGALVTHRLYFLPTQTVAVDDEVTIDGTVYLVRALMPPSEPTYVKVLAEERQPGA